MYLISNLQQYLESLKKQRDFVQKKLKEFPKGKVGVYQQIVKGKTYDYYRLILPNGTRQAITKNKNLIAQYAQKKYYELWLSLLDANIYKANMLTLEFYDISAETILNLMPEALKPYVNIPNPCGLRLPTDPVQAKKLLDWSAAPYERNKKHVQELQHMTSGGCLVRSKSEVIIYEQLKANGLAFRYENPVVVEGMPIYIDFTILRTDLKLWYWEHCGLMNKPQYIADLKWKLEKYEKVGIVPWDNLILTFDDENGKINMKIIQSEIRNKLILP